MFNLLSTLALNAAATLPAVKVNDWESGWYGSEMEETLVGFGTDVSIPGKFRGLVISSLEIAEPSYWVSNPLVYAFEQYSPLFSQRRLQAWGFRLDSPINSEPEFYESWAEALGF